MDMRYFKQPVTWLQLFVFAGMVNLVSIVINHIWIHSISKYLLMPLLAMYVLMHMPRGAAGRSLLLTALVFSWLGDVFLLYTERNELYFMLGLAAFLLAHLAYIFTFLRLREKPLRKHLLYPWIALPIAYALYLCYVLYPGLGDMRIPVLAYATVITLMCIAALFRMGRTPLFSFLFVQIGAIIFIASDSMIAWNMFYRQIPMAGLLIMTTYIIAQYLIVTGLMQHRSAEDATKV